MTDLVSADAPQPTAPITPPRTRLQRLFAPKTVLILLVLSMLSGAAAGLAISYQNSLTNDAQAIKHLADYKPSLVTKVYADDGTTVIGEFSLERRIPITYDQIPLRMRQALMAIEDARFEQHWGIDPIGIGRAGWRNFQAGASVEGGSTLTQQLAKMLFLSPEKSLTRKMKEALLALQIERNFSKQQILELYCNQIFLGGGAYGIEAGAQYYFSKSVKDLDLSEIALLAGLPKAPSAYSPTRDIKRAQARRNLVLENMAQEGFISREEAEATKKQPLKLNVAPKISNNNSAYGYFVEEVRQYLEDNYGTKVAQTSGLKVYTTLDADAQQLAVQAVRRGLHAYEHRHPNWKGNFYNVITTENIKNLAKYHNSDWDQYIDENMYVEGLVVEVTDKTAQIRVGDYLATVTSKDVLGVVQPVTQTFKVGDLVVCHIKKANPSKHELTVIVEQFPEVSGAFICVDAATGDIKVMVGGYDFNLSKFNNATQGNRQTGSCFKPFIYSTAIENGWTADETISDSPVSYGDWTPHNYDRRFYGSIPLYKALAQSRNIPAVKLLEDVGIKKGAEMVRRFGITNPMAPYLPSALGATEVPLIEMVSAYSTFPNMGQHAKPRYIRRIIDSDGRLIAENKPESTKVISPYVASTMVEMMQGVVENGTAKKIRNEMQGKLNERPIAGKTGTVNDFTDAWFIGYTPKVAAGFWIGYQGDKRSLGKGEAGAEAALPIWIDFMKFYLEDTPIDEFPELAEPDDQVIEAQTQREEERVARYEAAVTAKINSSMPIPPSLMIEGDRESAIKIDEHNLPPLPPPPPPPPPKVVIDNSTFSDKSKDKPTSDKPVSGKPGDKVTTDKHLSKRSSTDKPNPVGNNQSPGTTKYKINSAKPASDKTDKNDKPSTSRPGAKPTVGVNGTKPSGTPGTRFNSTSLSKPSGATAKPTTPKTSSGVPKPSGTVTKPSTTKPPTGEKRVTKPTNPRPSGY